MSSLVIQNLHVSIGEKAIVKGLTLTINSGEVHAIMGPNGTGKSTLSKAIAGHPDYTITSGDVLLDGKSILEQEADERARAGLFLAFQYPSEIPGVSIANFLRAALQARMAEGEEIDATAYYKRLYSKMDLLKIDRKFTSRSVNDGFSGGEKKRCEILQMAMLEPKFALMDETDSGLDIDALRIVSEGVNVMRGPNLGVLLITHYQRLLDYIIPDYVHVMYDGRIVKSGDKSLALELEAKGYDWIKKELAAAHAHALGHEGPREHRFRRIRYYLSHGQKPKRSWDEVPDDIKKTFERLGIPEQERKFLAGVEAQFDSEAAYSNIKEIVAKQGVIFVNSTEGPQASTPRSSRSGSAKSSRPATTNSPRSTAPCSPAAPSSTSPRA
jgi:Fe-S cluster assembly ATP-binding protein